LKEKNVVRQINKLRYPKDIHDPLTDIVAVSWYSIFHKYLENFKEYRYTLKIKRSIPTRVCPAPGSENTGFHRVAAATSGLPEQFPKSHAWVT